MVGEVLAALHLYVQVGEASAWLHALQNYSIFIDYHLNMTL